MNRSDAEKGRNEMVSLPNPLKFYFSLNKQKKRNEIITQRQSSDILPSLNVLAQLNKQKK